MKTYSDTGKTPIDYVHIENDKVVVGTRYLEIKERTINRLIPCSEEDMLAGKQKKERVTVPTVAGSNDTGNLVQYIAIDQMDDKTAKQIIKSLPSIVPSMSSTVTPDEQCRTCKGIGIKYRVQSNYHEHRVYLKGECPSCQGSGKTKK